MPRKPRGSRKGKISSFEWLMNFARRWFYWVCSILAFFIGDAASWMKDNWSSIQGGLPWYIAAALFGAIGVVLMMRDNAKVKRVDTRPIEERHENP